MLKKAYDWLVKSSEDPAKLSLTLRGFSSFLVFFGIEQTVIDEGTNVVAAFIVGAGMLASASVSVIGFARKLYNSFK